ncbi:hypothetical protein JTB14_025979 [Gonioctena quinquepunctata]|nr:hypothetical protein JTB14_025979 [Gonioctena quinquepunctata]
MCGFSDRENIARLQKCLKDLPNETRAEISEVEVVHHHMKKEENKVLLRVAPVVINGPKDNVLYVTFGDNGGHPALLFLLISISPTLSTETTPSVGVLESKR